MSGAAALYPTYGLRLARHDQFRPLLVQPVRLVLIQIIPRDDRVDFRRHARELFFRQVRQRARVGDVLRLEVLREGGREPTKGTVAGVRCASRTSWSTCANSWNTRS